MRPPVGWEREGTSTGPLWYVLRCEGFSLSVSAKVECVGRHSFAITIMTRRGTDDTTSAPVYESDMKQACQTGERLAAQRVLELRKAGYWQGLARIVAAEAEAEA